ncbi:MAG: TolC family protein [Armatimonadetes bacterium]|nr:TolC family protein [Armatimonadota bacterium]MDE2206145.1 TolC family protein [Armatimonadota bacterium]
MRRGATLLASIALSFVTVLSWAQSGGKTPRTPPIEPPMRQTPLPTPLTIESSVPVPADVPNRPLTAAEAVQIALHNQPSLAIARAAVAAAHGAVLQARSGLLPSLALSASYTNTQTIAHPAAQSTGGTSSGSGSSGAANALLSFSGFNTGASVKQLLFDFNHTRDTVRQEEALERSANAAYSTADADLALQVKQLFYAYDEAKHLVTLNETNVSDQQSHLDLAQARLRSGLGEPSDVLLARTALDAAIQALTTARNANLIARLTLAAAMGVDPRLPLVPADAHESAPVSVNIDQSVAEALTHRPEMAQFTADVQAAAAGLDSARTSAAPSLSASLGLSGRGSAFTPQDQFFSAGLSLQWTPFDSGLTTGRIKSAQAGVQSSQAALIGERQQIVSDVASAAVNLQAAMQHAQTAASEVANAQESVRIAEGRYRSGVGIFLDLLDAQSAYVTAQTDQINADAAVDEARAALAHAVGAP